MISLGALKNLGCVSRNFPYSEMETVSYLTDHDDRDNEEEDKEEAIKPRSPTPDKPTEPPFPPVEENAPNLRAWLVDQFSSRSFNMSSAPLAKMTGMPMKIHIDPEAIPIAAHKPIPISHQWQEIVKSELDRDCELGIIEKVPVGVPTKWQSRMVGVAKKSGKPRRTVHLSPLNKHCSWETHSTETPFNQMSRVEHNT